MYRITILRQRGSGVCEFEKENENSVIQLADVKYFLFIDTLVITVHNS